MKTEKKVDVSICHNNSLKFVFPFTRKTHFYNTSVWFKIFKKFSYFKLEFLSIDILINLPRMIIVIERLKFDNILNNSINNV